MKKEKMLKQYRLTHRRSMKDVKYHTRSGLAKINYNISRSVADMNQELEALRNEFFEKAAGSSVELETSE